MPDPPSDLESCLDRAEREPHGAAARILRRAEALFAARGFDGVTTRDVATAAGVNVSTLHFHWASKRTLYEAVCRLQARQLFRFVERTGPASEPRDLTPVDRIERWVDRSVELLCQNPAIAPLAWQSVSGQSAPDLPTLLLHDVAVFRRIESELRKALAPGREGDAPLLLLVFFYFAVGLFSDSALQRAFLDGSVRDSPRLRAQVRGFLRRLVRTFLDETPALPRDEPGSAAGGTPESGGSPCAG